MTKKCAGGLWAYLVGRAGGAGERAVDCGRFGAQGFSENHV